jgi:predicted HNH restriction endonuclease
LTAAAKAAAAEGDAVRDEALFRVRNEPLIRIKKRQSNYRCEACGFHFESKYGGSGTNSSSRIT